jgi:hypothetical protein
MVCSFMAALIAATLTAFGNLCALLVIPSSVFGGMSDFAFDTLLLGQTALTIAMGAASALAFYQAD